MAAPAPHPLLGRIGPGDHICHIYADDEELPAFLTPYVHTGIERGERILIAADAEMLKVLRHHIRNDCFATGNGAAGESLRLLDLEEACRQVTGADRVKECVRILTDEVRLAAEGGFAGLRSWMSMDALARVCGGRENLADFESRVDSAAASGNLTHVCAYDRRTGDAAFLMDAVTAHPLIALGARVLENHDGALKHGAHLEKMDEALARVSALLLQPGEPDFDEVLGTLGRAAEVTRAHIFFYRDDGRYADNAFEWCAEGIEPQIAKKQGLATAGFPFFMEKLLQGENIVINDISQLPGNAVNERGLLMGQGAKSALGVPIAASNGELIGTLGFSDSRGHKHWTRKEVRILKVVSESISAFLQRSKSEARYRALAESARDIIFTLSTEGTILSLNPAFESITGWAKDDWLTRKLDDLVHEDDRLRLRRAVKEAIEGSRPAPFICRFESKSGEYVFVETSVTPLMIAGVVTGVSGISRDITERLKTQEELATKQADYEAIFNNVSDAVLVHDLETGRVLDANKAALDFYGYTLDELKALRIEDLSQGEPPHPHPPTSHPPTSQREAMEWLRKAATEGPQLVERMEKTRDGRLIYCEVSLKRAHIGGHDCILAVVRDVDERRRLEQQLLRAQRMEALGRVAGGVAHDFNNVLAAITGYSELALGQLGNNRSSRRDIEAIRNVALKASALTRQLLTFSSRQPVRPANVNLNDIIGEIQLMLRPVLGRNIEVRTRLQENLGSVKADPGALEQALVNLAINSRDAMPEGGILTFSTVRIPSGLEEHPPRPGLDARPYVRLRVSDNGVGMDVETIERVFEPFFTTKDPGEGTGLGLSTVYAIVKQCRGEIFFDSTKGHGATCTIYLPASEEKVAAVAEGPPGSGVKGALTLLVDDNETLRDFLKEVLESRGYRVIKACDGQEALEKCRAAEELPDLLVTDVVMPRLDGYGLALKLREKQGDLPVLFVSGYPERLAEGMRELPENAEFLEKPFTLDALLRKIEATVRGPRAKASSAGADGPPPDAAQGQSSPSPSPTS